MIDLHAHLLPGIDDGPADMDESVAIARAAEAAGILSMVATPHVSSQYPNSSERIGELVQELSQRLAEERIGIELLAGAEIALTHVLDIEAAELSRLRLGGSPWLLLEFPFAPGGRSHLGGIVREIQDRGHQVLLAHPERCPAFQRDPALLAELVGAGALSSITSGSLVGRFGEQVRRFALKLVRDELVHNVASDTHDLLRRPPSIALELSLAGLGQLAPWLTEDVPRAVLAGTEIPPRPSLPGGEPAALRRPFWTRLIRR